MGKLYSDLGDVYESTGDHLNAFIAYLSSAAYQADSGQTAGVVKKLSIFK